MISALASGAGLLSKSRYLHSALHRRSICEHLLLFNAKPIVVTSYAQKSFILFIGSKRSNIFTFPIIRMAVNYAETGRVDAFG